MKNIIAIAFLLLADSVFACKCENYDITDNFERSSIVVYGKVVKTYLDTVEFEGRVTEFVKADVDVIEAYKGGVSRITVSDLIFSGGNCSTDLFAGKEYVFFVQKDGGFHFKLPNYVGSCTGTRKVGRGADVNGLEVLRMLSEKNS